MEEQLGYVAYNSKISSYLTSDSNGRPEWGSLIHAKIYSNYNFAKHISELYGCELLLVNLSVVAKPLKD